ncbi:uncharacterized protein V2V93DRAFT_376240 [Kockiozyma suomiensis]|uniref:uncharacterized protein n=1 Tax=Kockiozyma suomiensis TaxID=1337062 RepID=UPI003343FE31
MPERAVQLIILPHRPVKSEAEIDANLDGPISILLSAPGLIAAWQGFKFEEKYVRIYLLLWSSLEDSRAFFTSSKYDELNTTIQPAMNGRKIDWQRHALLDVSTVSDEAHFRSILSSPAIEVAWTKVVEGKVHGYLDTFAKAVAPILEAEPGCDGFFISSQIENLQDQILLINWKSVDAHHVDFENKQGFRDCITALFDYYAVFVVPWHIVGLKKIFGDF